MSSLANLFRLGKLSFSALFSCANFGGATVGFTLSGARLLLRDFELLEHLAHLLFFFTETFSCLLHYLFRQTISFGNAQRVARSRRTHQYFVSGAQTFYIE